MFGVQAAKHRLGSRPQSRNITRSYFKTQVLAGMLPATYQGVALLLVIGVLGLVQSADVSNVSALGAVVLIMLRSLSYGQAVQSAYQGIIVGAPYVEQFFERQDQYHVTAVDPSGNTFGHCDSLEFRNVTFGYTDHPVLRDVSFRIESRHDARDHRAVRCRKVDSRPTLVAHARSRRW